MIESAGHPNSRRWVYSGSRRLIGLIFSEPTVVQTRVTVRFRVSSNVLSVGFISPAHYDTGK
jgi:hypothetical protein